MTAASKTISDLLTEPKSGLTYRVRWPMPSHPVNLLLLLHGVGGNETNLLGLAEGVADDTLVIFPRGPLQLGMQQFAWFRVTFTSAGPSIVPQEAQSSREAMIALVHNLQQAHSISSRCTVVAGFSQGGILSASVALTSPESVAGFGVLSGRILPEIAPITASKERLSGLLAFVGHGDFDSKLPVTWAKRSDQLLSELGVRSVSLRYPVDHEISNAMREDFQAWLKSNQRG